MQSTTFSPSTPKPWVSPTDVVVLPSPSGVGVMAVTSTYLPCGRSANFSRTSRWTLALYLPNNSRSSLVRPRLSATSRMGFSSAACAISRSLGTGVKRFILQSPPDMGAGGSPLRATDHKHTRKWPRRAMTSIISAWPLGALNRRCRFWRTEPAQHSLKICNICRFKRPSTNNSVSFCSYFTS